MKRALLAGVISVVVGGVGGCGSGSSTPRLAEASPADGGRTGAGPGPDAARVTPCQSGLQWDPNMAPGPEMFPGRSCNDCHSRENAGSGGDADAPMFAFAGTVFLAADEADDCRSPGAQGAEVWLTYADGARHRAVVDTISGNFYSESGESRALPYRAEVHYAGRVRAMALPQTASDCNSCHTAQGANGAPGRILLP